MAKAGLGLARPIGRDRGARIQFKRVPSGVFSMYDFAPQLGYNPTWNHANHKTKPGIKKKGTQNHEKKAHLEL